MTSLHSSLDALSTVSPSQSTSYSSHRTKLQTSSTWIDKLDVVDVLGGEGEEGYGSGEGTYGHTGCINALCWSNDGSLLASGSDDKKICLWKIGQEPQSTHPGNPDVVQHYPSLGMGLSAIIHTGHRANIFSVKFSPTNTNVLFSCAGDHEVRVFDMSLASSISSSSTYRSSGREWTEFPRPPSIPSNSSTNISESNSALTRVFRCHRGRVKRIATEEYSDSVLLTCSEDGSVRQHDLRVGHTCKRDCPPPLCDYRPMGMGLYSLTTTPLRPELFVVAGTSAYAYLHDRRMVPRTMREQWGIPLSPTSLTQCVRRFGPAIPPLVPAPISSRNNDDSNSEEDEDVPIPTLPPHIAAARARARRAKAQTRAMQNQEQEDKHVTAAKLSATNGRELLLTYSGGGACLYDIFDNPEEDKPSKRMRSPTTGTGGSGARVGISTSFQSSAQDMPSSSAASSSKRNKLDLPVPKSKPHETPRSELEEAAVPTVLRPEERSDFVASTSLAEDKDMALQASIDHASADRAASEDVYAPAPSVDRTSFEIRVSDDGELEMEIGGEADDLGEESEGMNREGHRELLANAAAQAEIEEGSEDDEEEDEDTDMIDEDDTDDIDEDEEDISSSDDPDTAGPSPAAAASISTIPLIRPQRIYTGHRNVDTVKDVNFGGGDDSLVISGSDDGNVFIYSKTTSDLLGIYEGDGSVVNVMQWHPTKLPIMAVSGIDNSIKILAPTNVEEKKYSRIKDKERIMAKNRDSSWSSQSMMGPPSSVLLNLLSRATAGAEGDQAGGEGGERRRIPLSTLLQMAREGGQEGNEDCRVM